MRASGQYFSLARSLLLEPLRQQKYRLVTIVGCLACLALAQTLLLLSVGPFLKSLFEAEADQMIALVDLLPLGVRKWATVPDISMRLDELVLYVPMMMVTAALVKGVATFGYQYQQQALALTIATHFRNQLFASIIKRPFATISKRSPGQWMSILMNDVNYLQSRFSDICMVFFRDSVLILACFSVLIFLHPYVVLALAVLVLPLFWGMGHLGRKISLYASKWQIDLSFLSSRVLDIRGRLEMIRVHHGQSVEISRFAQLNDSYFSNIKRSLLVRSSFAPGLEFFGFAIFSLALVAIGQGWLGQDFSAADLIQFLAAMGVMLRPLRNLGEQFTRYKETLGALNESLAVLIDGQKRQPVQAGVKSVSPWTLDRVQHVERMVVEYSGQAPIHFAGFDLRPRSSVALIGPSGGGKSTFLRVLAGLVETKQWQAKIALDDLVFHGNFVSQVPFLFQATIRENLSYGLPLPASDDAIVDALKKVNLFDEINGLGAGLDTEFDPVKPALSGGQVQRLVLARALLRPEKILLFDEATSAIDIRTEKNVIEILIDDAKQQKKVVFFVTHRTQFLDKFDEVWFVENGGIQFAGSHASLLKLQRYRDFVSNH